MTPTPVGMRCPDCAKQRPVDKVAARVQRRTTGGGLEVTRALILVNVLIWLAEVATGHGASNPGGTIFDHGALFAPLIDLKHEYWRLVTGGFLHDPRIPFGILHIGFNMYLLWILGQMLEPAIGSVRFAAIYFTALLAGSFGAVLVTPHSPTVGASGAVFGLMGAAFIELRSRGIDPFQAGIGGLIVINLIFSFAVSNISVGGHIGGLIGGGLAMLALHYGDRLRRPALGLVLCAALTVASVAAGIAASAGSATS
jgi:membrane associated rhomboid family serine protease